jgi:hypothetical protein
MIERRPALGKGLSALIPDAPDAPRSGPMKSTSTCSRKRSAAALMMDDTKLDELARRSKPTASSSRSWFDEREMPIGSSRASDAGAPRSARAC